MQLYHSPSSSKPKNLSKMNQFRTSSMKNHPPRNTKKQEVVVKIPGCTAFLMDEGEAVELASGEFRICRVVDRGGFPVATVVKVGKDLQWPLTRDEPVVKMDSFHYLFSLPMKDGCPLSYGLTFPKQQAKSLGALDSFLEQNSCFSSGSASSYCDSESVRGKNKSSSGNLEWKQVAPRIEDYNNVLARGIAEGTLQIVRGIFMCSNVYSNLVHRCAEMILNGGEINSYKKPVVAQNGNRGAKKGLKRARDLSRMTEEVSKAMVEGANMATGSVMGPVLNSQPGKTILASLPGELLLASLDAINKILDAAEAAEKQAVAATTAATTRVVSQRYGEGAAETTGDVLATAGHCANTAWNVVKFRRAINPASSVATGVNRNIRNH
ncbi:Senescence/dehydration-associated protein At4g35985, chloroplastic [Linum grandiflorum]